jgi:hypothetical protein
MSSGSKNIQIKYPMKKMTTKLMMATAALTLIVFLTSFNKPQTNGNKYLIMRAYEGAMGGGSKIVIVYEDGKTEEQDIDVSKPSNYLPNAVKLAQSINYIATKGYELVTSSSGDFQSTYVFIKK